MLNVIEGEYRKLYVLYFGKICIGDMFFYCWGCIIGKVIGIGRIIFDGYGFRGN